MDGLEIAEFLGSRSTGVLSLASDGDGYGFPVSFAFDEGEQDVYFRLGYAPESQKRSFLEETERASFVVHADTDDGWKSVVARGTLEELSETSQDSVVVESVRNLEIPFYAVHDRDSADLEFRIVRLHVSELDGLVEGTRH